jgi:hypothetical protein
MSLDEIMDALYFGQQDSHVVDYIDEMETDIDSAGAEEYFRELQALCLDMMCGYPTMTH